MSKIKRAELYSESYLTKPFTHDQLLDKIQKVLRRCHAN